MKQKDITAIAISVFVAGMFSYIICNNFIITGTQKKEEVEVVTPITSTFNLPDKAIFNNEAIDPTQLIEIGPNSNSQPFVNK